MENTIKKCSCGCGKEISPKPFHKYYGSPDFLAGHWRKGKPMSNPPWNKGKKCSPDRADIFKPFGFETLIIWERELKDRESIERKICSFHERI